MGLGCSGKALMLFLRRVENGSYRVDRELTFHALELFLSSQLGHVDRLE